MEILPESRPLEASVARCARNPDEINPRAVRAARHAPVRAGGENWEILRETRHSRARRTTARPIFLPRTWWPAADRENCNRLENKARRNRRRRPGPAGGRRSFWSTHRPEKYSTRPDP